MTEQEELPIMIGVDGSEAGRRAVDWVLREAQVRHCGVQVVHAWTYEPMADFRETSSQQLHQESLAMLHHEVERATSCMTDIPLITYNSVRGDPASVLPEVARGAAMLVVGRHQGGLLRQALLGSVSAVCVRHASCPVVVIPAAVTQPEKASSAEPAAASQSRQPGLALG
jgi:nucleotide-binding universal stress UspA family protein